MSERQKEFFKYIDNCYKAADLKKRLKTLDIQLKLVGKDTSDEGCQRWCSIHKEMLETERTIHMIEIEIIDFQLKQCEED